MTDRQRIARRTRIAARARLLEHPPALDPDDVDALATQRRRAASGAIGAAWVVYRGAAEAIYGHPFWRGRW
jgi:hypothetical protein